MNEWTGNIPRIKFLSHKLFGSPGSLSLNHGDLVTYLTDNIQKQL
jgi:hypothetical protein